ncbi:NUDIX hydrolase [Priestia koreensis]|uniref:NUDIX hydrolase n=1 Tax=Priestia koreensis TaxID=284581 RepID=UPI00204021A1|nr:NUDIX domain-containing protein [Priestia koreensis]MCM3004075.1 NUDIX domain-containing protein [Priestia koreensis]
MTTTYVTWGESRVKLTWQPSHELPDRSLITSVHGFCFQDGNLLMVKLDRGWDFPGGHIEGDETPEHCFAREALEEAYVKGTCELLGYMVIDHNENSAWSEDSPYPKVGFQVFYKMDILELLPFEGKHESVTRTFISPSEVDAYYEDWHNLYQEILDQALVK